RWGAACAGTCRAVTTRETVAAATRARRPSLARYPNGGMGCCLSARRLLGEGVAQAGVRLGATPPEPVLAPLVVSPPTIVREADDRPARRQERRPTGGKPCASGHGLPRARRYTASTTP